MVAERARARRGHGATQRSARVRCTAAKRSVDTYGHDNEREMRRPRATNRLATAGLLDLPKEILTMIVRNVAETELRRSSPIRLQTLAGLTGMTQVDDLPTALIDEILRRGGECAARHYARWSKRRNGREWCPSPSGVLRLLRLLVQGGPQMTARLDHVAGIPWVLKSIACTADDSLRGAMRQFNLDREMSVKFCLSAIEDLESAIDDLVRISELRLPLVRSVVVCIEGDFPTGDAPGRFHDALAGFGRSRRRPPRLELELRSPTPQSVLALESFLFGQNRVHLLRVGRARTPEVKGALGDVVFSRDLKIEIACDCD